MALTKEEVKHVARLARLHLNDDEVERFTEQLGSVFEHLDTLAEVDTDGVEETAQVNGLENISREDLVKPSMKREDFLKASERPNSKGMIQVRKSI